MPVRCQRDLQCPSPLSALGPLGIGPRTRTSPLHRPPIKSADGPRAVTGDPAKVGQTGWSTATRRVSRHRPRTKPTGRTAPIQPHPLTERRRRCLRRTRALGPRRAKRTSVPSISAAGAGWCGGPVRQRPHHPDRPARWAAAPRDSGNGQERQRDRAEHAEQEERAEDGEQADRAAQQVTLDRGGRERGTGGRCSHLWRCVARARADHPPDIPSLLLLKCPARRRSPTRFSAIACSASGWRTTPGLSTVGV